MIPRRELLYNEARLMTFLDEHETAVAIKSSVDTNAFVYEIRSAIRYWTDGRNDYRISDAIWERCKAVDEGNLALVNGELVYQGDIEP